VVGIIPPTRRLYWDDDHCFEAEAYVVEAQGDKLAFDQTCFYPGGGGQPSDQGTIAFPDGRVLDVTSAHSDDNHVVWHTVSGSGIAGETARMLLNRDRRITLMRYHTVLHLLNTIVLRDYNGWITGVQIGVDQSRIDFKLEGLSPEMRGEIEAKVNGVLDENRALKSFYIAEEEFAQRPDLLRTLEVKPPVLNGRVRVVEIDGFDAQACGGTHVATTADVGRFSIFRTENKGKINKRLYIRLH
jgi:misacylated tRNA(Ala) deacylase